MIPRIMGFPLWYGHIKNRVALKNIGFWKSRAFWKSMTNISIGDLVQNCSGYNVRIAELEPKYYGVGKGFVLYDITITNDKGGLCSFRNCGVEPPKKRADIVQYMEGMLSQYGDDDPWDFKKRYEFTTINELGQATFDREGCEAKYGKQ